MAALIGIGTGTSSNPPPHCLALGSHVAVDLDGNTKPIETLFDFKAVVMRHDGTRGLMNAKVFRTVKFGKIEVFSIGKKVHVSGGHLLLLPSGAPGVSGTPVCPLCVKDRSGSPTTTADCRRCGVYSGLEKATGLKAVVARDWRGPGSPFTKSQGVNVWYHVQVFDDDGKRVDDLPFELADGIYSEPLRSDLTSGPKAEDWTAHK